MIAVRNLTLELGGRRILDGISFDVPKGAAVALVGPNGSGKTSVLRCLLGLVPFDGYAAVDGYDVVKRPVDARRLCGYLPQKPAFGDVTATEVLAFVAKLRRLDWSRIPMVLEEVGLAACGRQRVRTFSGGMQQRLSLAVAILTQAPVLLLDEPTASLDRDGQATFLAIASRLRREGRTLLLSSHRAEEIARLTDEVIALESGRIVREPQDDEQLAEVIALSSRVEGHR